MIVPGDRTGLFFKNFTFQRTRLLGDNICMRCHEGEMQGFSFGRSYWSRWAKVSTYRNWSRCLSQFQFLSSRPLIASHCKSFHLSQTGPGVFHDFNYIFHAPSSHRTAFFMPPHRIALKIAIRNDE